jgi:uncharacterized protein involved in type VI secretion and phage assembly
MRTGELYQRYFGLYLATVLSIDDPEHLGRIRVKMDQFDDSSDDPVWAAIARPAGGQNTTAFFTPAVGDQVVVGFLVGDVNGPIVVGYSHSTKQKPPEQVNATAHGVVTKIGRIIFDEKAQRIEVVFDAGSGTSSIVMDNDGVSIKSDKDVSIEGSSVSLKAQSVCVNGDVVVLKKFIENTYAAHTHVLDLVHSISLTPDPISTQTAIVDPTQTTSC